MYHQGISQLAMLCLIIIDYTSILPIHPIQPLSVRLNSINVGKTIINYIFGNGYHHLGCLLFYATLPTLYLYLESPDCHHLPPPDRAEATTDLAL